MKSPGRKNTDGTGLDARFAQVTSWTARQAGSPVAFGLAALVIIVWAVMGPFLDYADVWQLTVNTATTIVTFLMVFIIQNSQNRDAEALQIKIDELIRANLVLRMRCSTSRTCRRTISMSSASTIASSPNMPAQRASTSLPS